MHFHCDIYFIYDMHVCVTWERTYKMLDYILLLSFTIILEQNVKKKKKLNPIESF
jgi:hypothetical protein